MHPKRDLDAIQEAEVISLIEHRHDPRERLSELLDPPALSLDERGLIQDCNRTFEKLSGFRRCELVWQHISSLFPKFTDTELIHSGKINPLLQYLCHCGQLYQMQNLQGETVLSYLNLFKIENDGRSVLRLIVHLPEDDEVDDAPRH